VQEEEQSITLSKNIHQNVVVLQSNWAELSMYNTSSKLTPLFKIYMANIMLILCPIGAHCKHFYMQKKPQTPSKWVPPPPAQNPEKKTAK